MGNFITSLFKCFKKPSSTPIETKIDNPPSVPLTPPSIDTVLPPPPPKRKVRKETMSLKVSSYPNGRSSYEVAEVKNVGTTTVCLLDYYICGSRGDDGAILHKPWKVRRPSSDDILLGNYLPELKPGYGLWIISGPGRKKALKEAGPKNTGRKIACRATDSPKTFWNDDEETAYLAKASEKDGKVCSFFSYCQEGVSSGIVCSGQLSTDTTSSPSWCPGRRHQDIIDGREEAYVEYEGVADMFQ